MAAMAQPRAPILNRLTIEVNVECEAFDEGVDMEKGTERLYARKQCGRFTDRGNLCEEHAVELLGVRVAPSDIAGLGLFAAGHTFHKGDVICPYLGEVMTSAEFEAEPSAYAVRLYRGVLDARRSSDGFGRYANAARRKRDVNAQLISESKLVRGGSGKKIFLQATKKIEDGAEILLAYGTQYHRANRLPPGAQAV